MRLLSKCASAALAAVFLCPLLCPVPALSAGVDFVDEVGSASVSAPSALDAERAFDAFGSYGAQGLAALAGRRIAVEIDLAASPGYSLDAVGDRREARYRMAFNNVAEGWNWRPLADPQKEDYYRAKFLPLKSVTVERGDYDGQDKIGVTQRMKVTWRYDYFLSFDNLYDFYARGGDDDAGFVAPLPPGQNGEVRMLAIARLSEPYVSESTTFWKATYGKPTDFTLKKRYLHGRLEAVLFYDSKDGRILGRVR